MELTREDLDQLVLNLADHETRLRTLEVEEPFMPSAPTIAGAKLYAVIAGSDSFTEDVYPNYEAYWDWDTEAYDPYDMWSSGDPYKLLFPVAGSYFAIAQCQFTYADWYDPTPPGSDVANIMKGGLALGKHSFSPTIPDYSQWFTNWADKHAVGITPAWGIVPFQGALALWCPNANVGDYLRPYAYINVLTGAAGTFSVGMTVSVFRIS